MRIRGVCSLLFLAASLLVFTTYAEASEHCPITGELPLAKLFSGKETVYRTGKLSALSCDGATVSVVLMARYPPAPPRDPYIHAQAFISLAAGQDKLIKVRYLLMHGERSIATGQETLRADEGKMNWEDGVDLSYPRDEQTADLALRIEATVEDR